MNIATAADAPTSPRAVRTEYTCVASTSVPEPPCDATRAGSDALRGRASTVCPDAVGGWLGDFDPGRRRTRAGGHGVRPVSADVLGAAAA
jgi:hypothetical protein